MPNIKPNAPAADFQCSYNGQLEPFLQLSNEDEVVVRIVARELSRRVRCREHAGRPFRILDIGGGPGTKTFGILSALMGSFAGIELVNIDPSPEWHSHYLKCADHYGLRGVVRQMLSAKWEDYSPDSLFDFVLCSHSAYGIREWQNQSHNENPLQKMVDVLAPQGVLCIVIQSRRNLVYRVQQAFSKSERGKGFPLICGSNIVEFASRLGLQVDRTQVGSKCLDVCFVGEGSDRTESLKQPIMSLMLELPNGVYFSLPASLRDDLESLILASSRPCDRIAAVGLSSDSGPRRCVSIEDDVLWYTKQR